jgi:hypothetical protein
MWLRVRLCSGYGSRKCGGPLAMCLQSITGVLKYTDSWYIEGRGSCDSEGVRCGKSEDVKAHILDCSDWLWGHLLSDCFCHLEVMVFSSPILPAESSSTYSLTATDYVCFMTPDGASKYRLRPSLFATRHARTLRSPGWHCSPRIFGGS